MNSKLFKTALFGYNKIETCEHIKNIHEDYENLIQLTINKNENELKLLEQKLHSLQQEKLGIQSNINIL